MHRKTNANVVARLTGKSGQDNLVDRWDAARLLNFFFWSEAGRKKVRRHSSASGEESCPAPHTAHDGLLELVAGHDHFTANSCAVHLMKVDDDSNYCMRLSKTDGFN
jgi:hypothetical protein